MSRAQIIMPLATEEINQIKQLFSTWLLEYRGTDTQREFEQRERVIRLEEELKHQRELMQQGFGLMEKRFDQVDKRFDQVDKRFEQVDKHFEQITRRIDRFMFWSFAVTVGVGGIVVGVIRYL